MAKAKAAAADVDGEGAPAASGGKKIFGLPLKYLAIGLGALLVAGGGGGYVMMSK